jgi:hypothetical protein
VGFATKEKEDMDAIIGRYRVRMEESGIVLGHASGINFDLTVDETVGLMEFLNAYRQTLSVLQHDSERDTDPCMERVVVAKKDEKS